MNHGVARKGGAFLWTGVMKTNPFLTTGHLPELAQHIQRSREGQAHFAGTGPLAATCGECESSGYWRQRRSASGEISQDPARRRLRAERSASSLASTVAAIPPATSACRVFVRREPA